MYNLNFSNLTRQLPPALLRKPKMLAWLRTLHLLLNDVNLDFTSYIEEKRKEVSFTGQTIVLEKLLNESYPAAADGIWIDNAGTFHDPGYGYLKAEGQPHPGFGYLKSEGQPHPGFGYLKAEDSGAVNFTVNVPVSVSFDETDMRVLIDKYKAAGMQYIIQTY